MRQSTLSSVPITPMHEQRAVVINLRPLATLSYASDYSTNRYRKPIFFLQFIRPSFQTQTRTGLSLDCGHASDALCLA